MNPRDRQRCVYGFQVALLAGIAVFVAACSTDSALRDDELSPAQIPPGAIELYEISGLALQMESVRPQIMFGLEQHRANMPPEVFGVIESVVSKQFENDLLRERAMTILADAWVEDHARSALEWLNGDVGRRITRLEEYSSTSEGMIGIQQFAANLTNRPPGENRIAAIRRLNEAYGGTDFLVDATLAISLAVAVGTNAASPEPEQLESMELRHAVEDDRAYLRTQMDELILIYHLYTYSGLIDDEIVAYAEFLESDSGSWYVHTLSDAYIRPLVDLSMDLSAVLKQALE